MPTLRVAQLIPQFVRERLNQEELVCDCRRLY